MENRINIYDLHGHFLPGMDDGCKTVREAIDVLKISRRQNVQGMFATPHYYPVESVEDFLTRREEARQRLMDGIKATEEPLPAVCMGAEVAYRPGLSYEEDLEKLCLGKSRYLLLELPFSRWSEAVLRDVRNMVNVRGFTPILAHIERYLPVQSGEMMAQMLDMDVIAQMNGEYLLDFWHRRKGYSLLKNGKVRLLGSDCHNTGRRPPNLGFAYDYLQKRGGQELARRTAKLSAQIFKQAMTE